MRTTKVCDIIRCRMHWSAYIHLNAKLVQQFGNFNNIVTMPETQRRWANQVTSDFSRPLNWMCKLAHNLIKGFIRAEILFPLITWQFQRHYGNRQPQRFGQTTRIILDQFGGTRRAHQQ